MFGDRCSPGGCLPGWRLRAGPNQEERSSPPSSRGPSALLSSSLPLPLRLLPRFLSALPYLGGTFSHYLSHGVSPPLPPRPTQREDKLVKGRVVAREGPLRPRRKGTAGAGAGSAGEGRAGGIFNPGQLLPVPGPAAPPHAVPPEGIPGRSALLAARRPPPLRAPQRGAEITSGCGSRSEGGPGWRRAHPCRTPGHTAAGAPPQPRSAPPPARSSGRLLPAPRPRLAA